MLEELGRELATSTIPNLLVPSGLFAGFLNLLLAMLPDFYLSFLKIWITLASFLGLRKRPHFWGVIYDSVTKRPLDPAYLSLFDHQGKEVASTITTSDGYYGFLVQPGVYEIKAQKNRYLFPSERLAGLEADILYDNLYFGGPIVVQKGSLITKNIPLDPLAFDWGQFAKRNRKLLKFYAYVGAWRNKLINWFFNLGFFISVFFLFWSYEPINIAIALLYIGIGLVHSATQRAVKSGFVGEGPKKLPASYAIVKVLSLDQNAEIAHAVCDHYGRYYCLVPPGKYRVRVERKKPDGSYEEISPVLVDAPQGIIKEKFYFN